MKNTNHYYFRYHWTKKSWSSIRVSVNVGGILILLAMLDGKAQPITKDQITNQDISITKDGYQTSIPGWVVKNGDTLNLGKGSLPNKDFAFLYENPASFGATTRVNGRVVRNYMINNYAGSKVVLKDLNIFGSKRMGFSVYAIAGVGTFTRYYVELDNAIEAGEILPPAEFRQFTTSSKPATSVADEIFKLKQLLDAGALTQAEYDAQKKKLLNQ